MSKYSDELKLQIVKEHKVLKLGTKALGKKYGIHHSLINQWISQYELMGNFTKPNRNYSGEFKLKVLNYQQEHHLSDPQTALIFQIPGQETICAWRKKYITGGSEALFQKQGRRSKIPKKSLIPNKPRKQWTEQEELAYLRMENAFLKKYLALVQEEEKQQQAKEKEKSQLSAVESQYSFKNLSKAFSWSELYL